MIAKNTGNGKTENLKITGKREILEKREYGKREVEKARENGKFEKILFALKIKKNYYASSYDAEIITSRHFLLSSAPSGH